MNSIQSLDTPIAILNSIQNENSVLNSIQSPDRKEIDPNRLDLGGDRNQIEKPVGQKKTRFRSEILTESRTPTRKLKHSASENLDRNMGCQTPLHLDQETAVKSITMPSRNCCQEHNHALHLDQETAVKSITMPSRNCCQEHNHALHLDQETAVKSITMHLDQETAVKSITMPSRNCC